jgi:ATP-dependent RNA helicase DDX31/DBP7
MAQQPNPTTSFPLEDNKNNKKNQTCASSKNTTDMGLVEDFSRSAPHQLSQLYMVVTSKLRLAALVSFLVARIRKGQSVVVFMSTCDSVDFHHLLFTKLQSILPSKDDRPDSGIFGTSCTLLKLHGNISHGERQQVLKELSLFQSNSKSVPSSTGRSAARSYVLLATDVAARGLNLPHLDWILQYDAPCEVTDYVHRVGRSARAGNAGHAIIFMLPSEEGYIDILKSHGLGNITALSLSSTLQTAAKLCPAVSISAKNNIDSVSGGKTRSNRSGEQFAAGILQQCEDCVFQDGATNKSLNKKAANKENLISLARQAFSAYIRAYPTKEKAVRHLFSTRALHLGHVARSFALKESPLTVSKTSKKDKMQTILGKRENAALTFKNMVIKKRKTFDLTEGNVQNINEITRVNSTKKKVQSHMAMIMSAKRAEQELSEFV